ncbi:MAG: GtrA family protein [Candidatus Pacebacteria bacterium]|nr:GtrA family protein [Candidatus Paceibacterota bacterium]
MAKIIRYLISGGIATGVDLFLLFLFKSIFHFWYLLSAILAFLVAFGVSFSLQKFWTFGDSSTHLLKSQMGVYFLITACNLGLNTLFMYLFVDILGIQYLISQIIASTLIAFESYFIYGRFVFEKK